MNRQQADYDSSHFGNPQYREVSFLYLEHQGILKKLIHV